MKTYTFISFLTFLLFFISLQEFSNADQAQQLRKLIRAQRLAGAVDHESWLDFGGNNIHRPVNGQVGSMEADMITSLPGQPADVDFNQYAGYVTVDAEAGRAFFYYFVEAPHNPSAKPLVLWLNGGPGCSSLGYGAMEELGPFRVNKDGKTLSRNYYSWNNAANVIFLESPAGVGFSYSNTSSDIAKSGDNMTAIDNYNFLINWLERFPQYKTRDFYITGESYAGHYIPDLAYTILQMNDIANQPKINLLGVAIGNAYINSVDYSIGGYNYAWTHALISDETYGLILSTCNFSSSFTEQCNDALIKADREQGKIDINNIYEPVCVGPNTSSNSGVAMAKFDPCMDNYVNSYLNLPEVQKALHANVTGIPYAWVHCGRVNIEYSVKDRVSSVYPIIQKLIGRSLRIWLYSGDVDSNVPITTTRLSIRNLGLAVEKPWRPWHVFNQVGGYVEQYAGLTLVTVRGAGHLVPSYQPGRALAMIYSFLKGSLPPV